MTTSADVFLGIIAAATLVMAVMQVGAILVVSRAARRVDRVATQIESDIKPLMANLAEVGQNAARASALAATQVERADRLFADVSARVDETFTLVQGAIVTPMREGRALVTAVRAGMLAFRELRAARRRARTDDEDALFIG